MIKLLNPFSIVFQECESGRYLCWYQDRSDIIANGDTKEEAEENLKSLYKSVIDFEYQKTSDKKWDSYENVKERERLQTEFNKKHFKLRSPEDTGFTK